MSTLKFNLEPPPGFRRLNPHAPLTIYHRILPHWRQAGVTYFVTFHLADALPAAKRHALVELRDEWELRNPPPRDEATWTELTRSLFLKVEAWMDEGHGACWFGQSDYADELHRAILHFHGQRYEVGCFALMANHGHLVIRPFDGFVLEDEVGAMKSIAANFVNRREGRRGDMWQQESYDRIIRDAEHLYRVVQYIGDNPRRAGIPRSAWRRWINPAWQDLGWDFHDGPRQPS